MMGYNHERSGAVVWLAGSAAVVWAAGPGVLRSPVAVASVVLGAAVCGYAARVPDIDHENSTVSRKWGAPLRGLYQLVRGLTWLLVALLSWSTRRAGAVDDEWFGHRCITHSAAFAVLAGALFEPLMLIHPGLWFVGAAVSVGCLTHTAGDMLTNSGCPIAAPWTWRRWSARLFPVNSRRERWIVGPALYGALCALPVLLVWMTAVRPGSRP